MPMTGAARFVVGMAILATTVSACGRAEPAPAPAAVDPGALVVAGVAELTTDDPYRDPTRTERTTAREGVGQLLEGSSAAFGDLEFRATDGVDPVTGRPFLLLVDESDRGWGSMLVDRSAPIRVVVQVPHPRFDINTEVLGVDVQRAVPGSVLLVAGAHRTADGGSADVAHNDQSFFHVVATEFARHDVPAIQLHGFADKNLPDAEAVVSSSAGSVSDLSRAVADGLDDRGLAVCRAWAKRCGRLEGTRNEQGRAAADRDTAFVHLELGWSIRSERERRDEVVEALAEVFVTR
jgi:hypothetical protein